MAHGLARIGRIDTDPMRVNPQRPRLSASNFVSYGKNPNKKAPSPTAFSQRRGSCGIPSRLRGGLLTIPSFQYSDFTTEHTEITENGKCVRR
jgi:hypothetical protein